MRRILTFATALAFVALFAMPAQAQEKGTTRLGLQAGVTSSSFSGDDVADDFGSKTGFFAGVGFNYFVAPNWSVGLEGNWLFGVGAERTGGEIKLSYLELPLTLNYTFPLGESEKSWLTLQSGFTALFNITCKEGPTGSVDIDCKDETESVAWAVPFGAGIGFQATETMAVYLRARYQLGLNDTFSDDTAAKMNIWEFMVGVGVPIG